MKVNILGTKIDQLSKEKVLSTISEYLNSSSPHFVITPNPEFLVAASADAQFREVLNQADLAVPDGMGLMLAGLFLNKPLKERLTGTDLVYELADICCQKHKSIYFLGALPGVAEEAAINLKKQFPNLIIAGFESGFRTRFYFKLPDYLLVSKINRARPDVLLVAFGAGQQEKWIYRHLNQFKSVKVAMGIGGAFDFISGRVKRSPKFFRKLGLEWLWRLGLEPWRFNRIVTATFRFGRLVLKDKKNAKV